MSISELAIVHLTLLPSHLYASILWDSTVIILVALAWSSLAFGDETGVATQLVITGIGGSLDHRLAIINNHTFGVGDEGDVRTANGNVHIRCIEIQDGTVVVEVNGTRHELSIATQDTPSKGSSSATTTIMIHDAALNGDLEKVKAFVKDDPNLVFCKDENGATPLLIATVAGHTEVVEMLLANKADANAKDNNGNSPLFYAVSIDQGAPTTGTTPPDATEPAVESKPVNCDIEITDNFGTNHLVSGCVETSKFFKSGTPFLWGDFYKGAPLLDMLVAVNFHTPTDQNKITDVAIKNGNREIDSENFQIVLMIPLSAIEDLTFAKTNVDGETGIISTVRLAGNTSFEAGEPYGQLAGRENTGALGTGNFSSWMENLSEIKALSPTPFVGNFDFFAAPEVPPKVRLKNGVYYGNSSIEVVKPLDLSQSVPFKVKVTDTVGARIILEQALFCEIDEELTGERDANGNYYDTTCDTLCFTSAIKVNGGTTIEASSLSKISVGRVDKSSGWGGFDANVILRSGQTYNLTITPRQGIYVPTGIIGYSANGWVWIPWQAVSNIDFDNF